MAKRDWSGRLLVTLAVLGTLGFQIGADWSFGHITNPDWPLHAKYHLIVYHLTLVLFGAVAVASCWRSSSHGLLRAVGILVAIWLPYYLAALFPQGSPYATPDLASHRVPVQFVVGGVLVAAGLLGWRIAYKAHTHNLK
jgi:hypothetical protein